MFATGFSSRMCMFFVCCLLLLLFFLFLFCFFFFKQKTAYEIRPRDWSSDVCSSDHTLPVRRLDDVKAARELDLVWKP